MSLEEQQHLQRCESDTEADFLDRNEESSSAPTKKMEKQNELNHSKTSVTSHTDKDIYAALQRSSDKKSDKGHSSSSQLANNNNIQNSSSSTENSVQVLHFIQVVFKVISKLELFCQNFIFKLFRKIQNVGGAKKCWN